MTPSLGRLRRRYSAAALLGVLALTGAGCSAGPTADSSSTAASTQVVGTITRTAPPTRTVTRTVAPPPSAGPAASTGQGSAGVQPGTAGSAAATSAGSSAGTAPATPSTEPPASQGSPASGTGSAASPGSGAGGDGTAQQVAGACPYLDDDTLAFATGQHTGQTSIVRGPADTPPTCVFTRSDGGFLAAVRPISAATAELARSAVDAQIPPEKSAPASQPAGWSGGSMLLPDGASGYPLARSVYGVSKGARAVIAWSNQSQTVTSRGVLKAAIDGLGW